MKKIISAFLLVALIFICASCTPNVTDDDIPKAPQNSTYYKGINYNDAYQDFYRAGFTNIRFNVIYDLTTGFLVSDGSIEYISIDGNKTFYKNHAYDKDVEVIICYHTFKSNKPSSPDQSNGDINGGYIGELYSVTIDLNFDANLFLDTYDVRLLINDISYVVIEHGQSNTFDLELKPGKHTITFANIDDLSIKGEMELNVLSDLIVTYKIKCHSSNIDMYQTNIEYLKYYTVKFDANGGSSVSDQKVNAGDSIAEPSTKKNGYVFAGWMLNGQPYDFDSGIYSDITLVAKWDKEPVSKYEYAFIRDLSNYDIYFLFDVDTNEYIYFTTNDTYIEVGQYSGDLSTERVRLIHEIYEGYSVYFKLTSSGGTYTDHIGNTFSFATIKPYLAEEVLEEIKSK